MLNHWLIAFSFVIFRNVGPLPGPAPRPFKVMFTWARNLKDKIHLFWLAFTSILFVFPSKFYLSTLQGLKGLKSVSTESEEPSDSNKVDFNPVGLTGAEVSALKVEK